MSEKLTDPQRRALCFLASVEAATPAQIGQGMATDAYSAKHSRQALGRVGGKMAWALRSRGLVALYKDNRYRITGPGRQAIGDAKR